MPVDMIEEVKVQANELDILYQSYIKMIIAQGIKVTRFRVGRFRVGRLKV